MSEEECVAEVAMQAKISKAKAKRAIEAFANLFFGALETGIKVYFPGGAVGGSAENELEQVLTHDLPYT